MRPGLPAFPLGVARPMAGVPTDAVDYYYWLIQGNEPWASALGELQRPNPPEDITDTIVIPAGSGDVTLGTSNRRYELDGFVDGDLNIDCDDYELVCTSNDAGCRRIAFANDTHSRGVIDGRRPDGSWLFIHDEREFGNGIAANVGSTHLIDHIIRAVDFLQTGGGPHYAFRSDRLTRFALIGFRAIGSEGGMGGLLADDSSEDVLFAQTNIRHDDFGADLHGVTRVVCADVWLRKDGSGNDAFRIAAVDGAWCIRTHTTRGATFGSFFEDADTPVGDIHFGGTTSLPDGASPGCEFYDGVAFSDSNSPDVGLVTVTGCAFNRTGFDQSSLDSQLSFRDSGDIATGNTFNASDSIATPPDPPGDPEELLPEE